MKNKQLTIRDISKLVEWKYIKKAYLYYYGKKGLDGLEPIFELIKTFRKQKQKEKGEVIEVMCGGFFEGELYERDDERFYNVHTNKYSLSFRKWREISNIPIQEETLRRYKFSEIMAHFLYEITFYGYDEEEIGKARKKVSKSYKEMIKDLKKYE